MTSSSARISTVGLSFSTLSLTSLLAPPEPSLSDSPYVAPLLLISSGSAMSSCRWSTGCFSLRSTWAMIALSSNHLVCPPSEISFVFFLLGSCQGRYPFLVQYQTLSGTLLTMLIARPMVSALPTLPTL